MITKFKLYENKQPTEIFTYINKKVDTNKLNYISKNKKYKFNLKKWINDNKENIDIINIDGWTPLNMISSYNSLSNIKLFIDAGADINHTINYGENSLFIYCIYNKKINIEILKLFINNGINWKLNAYGTLFYDYLDYPVKDEIFVEFPEILEFEKKRNKAKKFNI